MITIDKNYPGIQLKADSYYIDFIAEAEDIYIKLNKPLYVSRFIYVDGNIKANNDFPSLSVGKITANNIDGKFKMYCVNDIDANSIDVKFLSALNVKCNGLVSAFDGVRIYNDIYANDSILSDKFIEAEGYIRSNGSIIAGEIYGVGDIHSKGSIITIDKDINTESSIYAKEISSSGNIYANGQIIGDEEILAFKNIETRDTVKSNGIIAAGCKYVNGNLQKINDSRILCKKVDGDICEGKFQEVKIPIKMVMTKAKGVLSGGCVVKESPFPAEFFDKEEER